MHYVNCDYDEDVSELKYSGRFFTTNFTKLHGVTSIEHTPGPRRHHTTDLSTELRLTTLSSD